MAVLKGYAPVKAMRDYQREEMCIRDRPPKDISLVAKWMMVSLIHPPPKPQLAVIFLAAALFFVKK